MRQSLRLLWHALRCLTGFHKWWKVHDVRRKCLWCWTTQHYYRGEWIDITEVLSRRKKP